MKKYLIATILLAITITADIKALVINELMQSNVTTLFVENEFPDSWVELYNNSDSDIALDGYAIGDSDNFEKAWVIDSDEIVTAGSLSLSIATKKKKDCTQISESIPARVKSIYFLRQEKYSIRLISPKCHLPMSLMDEKQIFQINGDIC